MNKLNIVFLVSLVIMLSGAYALDIHGISIFLVTLTILSGISAFVTGILSIDEIYKG